MGIKKKKTFTQIFAVGLFLIFQKFRMTAKAMCLHIKLHNWTFFRLENKLQTYLVGLPEYCNTWKCFTYSFEAEKQGEFFLHLKNKNKNKIKNIDAEVWKWRARRPETIGFFGLIQQSHKSECFDIKFFICNVLLVLQRYFT